LINTFSPLTFFAVAWLLLPATGNFSYQQQYAPMRIVWNLGMVDPMSEPGAVLG
jgi:hypothetical protein